MRECGECTACCTWLNGDAYGYEFGGGKSCKYLCGSGCSIHEKRPEVCAKYFCAWAQELFPLEMRPDKCGILVSIENGDKGQYLKVTNMKDEKINIDTLVFLKNWSRMMNTPVFYLEDKVWKEINAK
jgi:hypothetical protein